MTITTVTKVTQTIGLQIVSERTFDSSSSDDNYLLIKHIADLLFQCANFTVTQLIGAQNG